MDGEVGNMDYCVVHIKFRSGHFRQGTEYEIHRPNGSPDWLLIYSVSGHGEHVIDTGSSDSNPLLCALPPGTALLYPPGVSQWYRTRKETGGWELMWAHFPESARVQSLLHWPPLQPGENARVRHLDSVPRFLELSNIQREVTTEFAALLGWLATARTNREQFAWNTLERLLLWCDGENPNSRDREADQRVVAVMNAVAENPSVSRSVAEMAESVGLSRTRLSHLFKQETGESFPSYVERRRMEQAENQLRMTSRPVSEIAALVGYDDPLYFSRRFKHHCGMSPREWRAAADQGTL
jgi:AraC family transcriptional regulator of arabinose operon